MMPPMGWDRPLEHWVDVWCADCDRETRLAKDEERLCGHCGSSEVEPQRWSGLDPDPPRRSRHRDPDIVIALDKCPHCHMATGQMKRGSKCKHCNGSGGFRAYPTSNARHGKAGFAGSRRVEREREAATERARQTLKVSDPWDYLSPCTVRFVRVAPAFLDDDNLRGACKAIRDGLADAFGLTSDRDPLCRWRYGQAKAGRGIYRVEIQLWRGQENCATCGQPTIPTEDP